MKNKFNGLMFIIVLSLILTILSGCSFFTENFSDEQIETDMQSEDYTFKNQNSDVIADDSIQVYLTDARDFSEGLAWVRISEFDSSGKWLNSHWACINQSGQKIYETEKSTDWNNHIADFNATDFVNGVSILDENTFINNNGEVVWSVENDGWNYANNRFGEGATKSIELSDGNYFKGYAFVKINVDSFDETANYCGVLNPDGSWRMEPIKVYDDISSTENDMGIFYSFEAQDDTRYFNTYKLYYIEDNKIVENTNNDDITSKKDLKNYKKSVQNFEDTKRSYYCALHNNLCFNKEKMGFENASGDLVLDLSGYPDIICKTDGYTGYPSYPIFNNGYSVLDVKNNERAKYMTVIDTEGTQLFEPIKCESHDNMVSDGLLLLENDEGQVYLNIKGETAIVPDGKASTFSEGYAVIHGQDFSLNIDMDIYKYIDTNGNIAIK